MENELRKDNGVRSKRPLDWMLGMVDSGETDLASRVDEIVYGEADPHGGIPKHTKA